MKKLLLIASLFFVSQSFADAIYTNLGPGDSYSGLAITAECTDCSFSIGTVFTASNTANLAQILVPVVNDTGSFDFELLADSGGQPGTLLESWTNVAVTSDPNNIPLVTLTSVSNPLITAGDVYWFLAISQITTEMAWSISSQLSSGGFWSGNGSAPFDMVQESATEAPQAIELDSAAPEPATWLLLGSSLLAVTIRRRSA